LRAKFDRAFSASFLSSIHDFDWKRKGRYEFLEIVVGQSSVQDIK